MFKVKNSENKTTIKEYLYNVWYTCHFVSYASNKLAVSHTES